LPKEIKIVVIIGLKDELADVNEIPLMLPGSQLFDEA